MSWWNNIRKFTHEHRRGLYTLYVATIFDLTFALEKLLLHFGVVFKPIVWAIAYASLATLTLAIALWDYSYDRKCDCEGDHEAQ